MTFRQKLETIVNRNNSLVCVGLDSDFNKLPRFVKTKKNPQFTFNKAVIDATHDLICAYKPNIAFYEARGIEGLKDLKLTFDYLRDTYPEIVTILDAKRADIGNTNRGYVKFAFDFLGADVITLHPYLGKEALKPFLERKDKGLFILCRTSNPGSGEFQDLHVAESVKVNTGVTVNYKDTSDGVRMHSSEVATSDADSSDGGGNNKPLYQVVAEKVAKDWNYNNNCGLVVGATYPEELKIVRRIVRDLPLLIPGIGAQGGDLEKTVKYGVDKKGQNTIINSSRGIIFAGKGADFALKAKEEAKRFRSMINSYKEISL